ncbi:hypothetical protein G6F68_018241 [Rhizopus microsporus]|nr:hypothetical protein G6F68_018241 [Rhizopus microsporus]
MNGGNGEIEISEGARSSVEMALIGESGASGSFTYLGEPGAGRLCQRRPELPGAGAGTGRPAGRTAAGVHQHVAGGQLVGAVR